jgi:malate/lactate dehydrogenase
MNRIISVLAFCALVTIIPATPVFAQDDGNRAEVTGTWRHEKEGLTFQFNADGSFTMSEDASKDGEETRKALEKETRKRGEAIATSVGGTYAITKGVINMAMSVDGKSHRLRMKYKKLNADTLQLEGQNYHRVN